jgi:hypothetical protein
LPVEPAARLLSVASRALDAIPAQRPRLPGEESVAELPPLESAAAAGSPPVDVGALATPSEQVVSAPVAEEPVAQPLAAAPVDESPWGESPTGQGEVWSPQWLGVRTISPPPPLAGEASLSVQVNEGQASLPVDVPTPLDFQRMLSDLRRLSTAELLEQLPTADMFSAGAIRKVLAERGIDAVEVELTSQIKSDDEADRLRLVDQASQLPAAAARRLLRLLVGDPSGDVRLRALTTLATTNDPGLADLARTMATEDEDPRVADLASRLLRQ